jgi:type II secretory pathway predicted ATPase ExeA/lambda repressor-like predicted transcriptional regulator
MRTALGDEAREKALAYQSRTGLSIGAIAALAGYAPQTMKQFMSGSYPHNELPVAKQVIKGIEANPPEIPDVRGKLYETTNVHILDEQLEATAQGALSLIYGAPGTQKSFVFQRRVAETLRSNGLKPPALGYVYASAAMGRASLVHEIARSFICFPRGTAYSVLTNLVFTLRRRERRPVLIIDECQHLGHDLSLLEVLRELTDRAEIGLIVAGHDDLEKIFDPDSSPLEQFIQRFDYRLRLPGLTEAEVRSIAVAELGQLKERALSEILKQSETYDRQRRAKYFSARFLFKVIAQTRAARAK